jgi:hypothetical protein
MTTKKSPPTSSSRDSDIVWMAGVSIGVVQTPADVDESIIIGDPHIAPLRWRRTERWSMSGKRKWGDTIPRRFVDPPVKHDGRSQASDAQRFLRGRHRGCRTG